MILARKPSPESRQFERDEKNRVKHMKGAQRGFKALLKLLKPLANKAVEMFPAKDKLSMQRRGRAFNKAALTTSAMINYLDTWIGTIDQHPKAYSWRGVVIYQARDVLLYGKTQKAALEDVAKQAFKGFEAITMAEAQAPYRETVPTALREFLPNNIVIEVDDGGTIKKVTDRFENEHLTLGVKISKMKKLVRDYNKIAKQVKKDFKSRDEITKMSAVITAVIMETGIRPGKAGNGKAVTQNGEEVFIETFGAITLGPAHVKFVRANFAELKFIGKKTSVNTAEIGDAVIIKALDDYVQKALKSGSKFVFVTKKGIQFTYADLQRYFHENFDDLAPTDFRKLKATETVLASLRNEQVALYTRIRGFAAEAKDDLKDRIAEAVVDTFEAAIHNSQAALSHDSAKTTIRAYINPEVILRFLSMGRVDENLKSAILGGETKLKFDPQVFLEAATGKTACTMFQANGRVALALGDLMLELRSDLEDAGVRKMAAATVRLASLWVGHVAGLHDLRPNTKMSVYHGTRLAHIRDLINGFDANKVVSRDYGGPRHAGLFVTPNIQTAERFSSYGEIILELSVTAKYLHGTDYSGNIGRSQRMDQRTVDHLRERYPDSFRPYLSNTLLQSSEPQALLRGLVKPLQIKRVRYKPMGGSAKWYSRAEFLDLDLEVKPANEPYSKAEKVRDFGHDMSDPTLTLEGFKDAMSASLGVNINKINRTFERMVGLGDRGRASIEQLIQRAGFGSTAAKVFLDKVFGTVKATRQAPGTP